MVVSRVLGHATRRGVIPTNPVAKLEKEELPRNRQRRVIPALDRDAIADLITHTPTAYRSIVALSILTGIRQGEALGLRWQDIDLTAGLVHIRLQLRRDRQLGEPKTAAAKRDIPIPPSLAHMLAQQRERASKRGGGKPTDFVFVSRRGRPFDRRNIARRGLNKALAAADLPHLRWHDLRHVAASVLIAEGASVPYLARVLGHASPAVTLATYAHEFARVEHADRARAQMEAAFGQYIKQP